MANIECWLGRCVIFVNFLGIKTDIAKKPYTFCYFSGGGGGGGSGDPCPNLGLRMSCFVHCLRV